MNEVTIRQATMDDMPDLLKIGRARHAEAEYPGDFDPEGTRSLVKALISMPTGVVHLAIVDDVIIGGIAGMVGALPLSTAKMMSTIMWYVKPDRRGGKAARMLLAAMDSSSKEMGASVMTIQDSKVESDRNSLGFAGFVLHERVHVKEYKNGA